jgi:hypothetical protein
VKNSYLAKLLPNYDKFIQFDGDREFIIDKKDDSNILLYKSDENEFYLTSKFNPKRESELFVNNLENLDEYEHIVFIGFGNGDVIRECSKVTGANISVVDPYVKNIVEMDKYNIVEDVVDKKNVNLLLMNNVYTIGNVEKLRNDLVGKKTKIVVLKSYLRYFPEEVKLIQDKIVGIIKGVKNQLYTNYALQKRWITNSVGNFKNNTQSSDIHCLKDSLKGKPVIIVSAGPSLKDEIENIKYILENNLAYVFAVGSSIRALLSYGIKPDAVFTYDPSHMNREVFTELISDTDHSIPMVYGSSVAFEVPRDYNGPKLHFVTSQDKIRSYYYNGINERDISIVNDSSSIATITLQIVQNLEMSPIIFVGQNYGFRDDRIYSEGIETKRRSSSITEKERKNIIEVEGYFGEKVKTQDNFVRMRQELDTYINRNKNLKYINTTKGGAKIYNAPFEPMDKVIENFLNENLEDNFKDLLEGNPCKIDDSSIEVINKNKEVLISDRNEITKVFDTITKILNKMNYHAEKYDFKGLNKQFSELDMETNNMRNNLFYKVFLEPLVRTNYQLLMMRIKDIKNEKNMVKKSGDIVEQFGNYISVLYDKYPYSCALNNSMNDIIDSLSNKLVYVVVDDEFDGDISSDIYEIELKTNFANEADNESIMNTLNIIKGKCIDNGKGFDYVCYVNKEILENINVDGLVDFASEDGIGIIKSKVEGQVFSYNDDGSVCVEEDNYFIGKYFVASYRALVEEEFKFSDVDLYSEEK